MIKKLILLLVGLLVLGGCETVYTTTAEDAAKDRCAQLCGCNDDVSSYMFETDCKDNGCEVEEFRCVCKNRAHFSKHWFQSRSNTVDLVDWDSSTFGKVTYTVVPEDVAKVRCMQLCGECNEEMSRYYLKTKCYTNKCVIAEFTCRCKNGAFFSKDWHDEEIDLVNWDE